MKFSLKELKIMERLLKNRISTGSDPDVEGLLAKIEREIGHIEGRCEK